MIEDILKVRKVFCVTIVYSVLSLNNDVKDFKKSKDLTVSRGPSSDYRPWSIVILRYFNPVGAHPSGLIGFEAPYQSIFRFIGNGCTNSQARTPTEYRTTSCRTFFKLLWAREISSQCLEGITLRKMELA